MSLTVYSNLFLIIMHKMYHYKFFYSFILLFFCSFILLFFYSFAVFLVSDLCFFFFSRS